MKKHDVDVLVVGAGPTGLTLACNLIRHGVSCRIIDKLDHASDKSKALAVHSRSLEVLEDMGIVDRFIEVGLKIAGVNVFADGKRIAHMNFEELDSPYSFTVSIPQSETERLLMEHLDELGASVERGLELVGLVQEKDSVICTLRGQDGSEQTLNAAFVAGCDGAHSTVRKALKVEFTGKKYPELVYLSDVHIEGQINKDEIYVLNGESGLIALFPYGGGRYRIAAIMGVPDDDQSDVQSEVQSDTVRTFAEPTIEQMQSIVNERSHFDLVLSQQLWSSALFLHRRHVGQYRVDNVFLAGDAAHIHSPAGGQGMNTGIQDSYNLAWKLALVAKGICSRQLLDSYSAERLEVALGVLRMTDFMMRVNTMKNPIGKNLRNTLAPILTAQEVVQNRMKNQVSELAINYNESPIVEEHCSSVMQSVVKRDDLPSLKDCLDFMNGPRAGDRAPDAFYKEGDGTGRLFLRMQGIHHLLVMFSGDETSDAEIEQFKSIAKRMKENFRDLIKVLIIVDSEESKARCGQIADAEIFSDFEMSCHHRFGAGSNCLYLLRPDGYVGFRSQPTDEKRLSDYLNRVFDQVKVGSSS